MAVAEVSNTPAEIATRRPVTGCASVQPYQVTAGSWRGSALSYRDCPGAVEVTHVGLADADRPGWVVWVEVRAVAGSPELYEVLRGITVDP